MRIAVIDESQKNRKTLAVMLNDYMMRHGIDGELLEYSGEEEFFQQGEGEEQLRFDTVFLDPCMNGTEGMEIARRIRSRDRHCRIMLVSDSDSFAREGYKVQAFRYLVRTGAQDEFYEALDELFESYDGSDRYIEMKEERIVRKLYLRDIEMAELEGHYICFYMKDGGTMRVRMTFRELLPRIRNPRFLECYRNVLVNLDYVECVEAGKNGWDAFLLKGGRRALIQKAREKQVRQYVMDFMSDMRKILPEKYEFCQKKANMA